MCTRSQFQSRRNCEAAWQLCIVVSTPVAHWESPAFAGLSSLAVAPCGRHGAEGDECADKCARQPLTSRVQLGMGGMPAGICAWAAHKSRRRSGRGGGGHLGGGETLALHRDPLQQGCQPRDAIHLRGAPPPVDAAPDSSFGHPPWAPPLDTRPGHPLWTPRGYHPPRGCKGFSCRRNKRLQDRRSARLVWSAMMTMWTR